MVNSKHLRFLFMSLLTVAMPGHAEPQSKSSKTWYEGPTVGWSFYREVPLRAKPTDKGAEKKQAKEDSKNSKDKGAYTYTQQAEKVRKDFDEAVAKAVLYPSLENTQEAQRLHNLIMNRATAFEKSWMVASLLSGDSYRESDRPSLKHRKLYEEQTHKQLEEDIHALAKSYGLFFIFKHECPYCHEMAPIVRRLVDTYGFAIKAISPGGDSLKEFPDAVRDNGTIGQLNPEGIFPVLFLINPQSGQAIPLARGLMSPSELKDNLKVIIQFLKDQKHAQQ